MQALKNERMAGIIVVSFLGRSLRDLSEARGIDLLTLGRRAIMGPVVEGLPVDEPVDEPVGEDGVSSLVGDVVRLLKSL
jgi:hypothetical protein